MLRLPIVGIQQVQLMSTYTSYLRVVLFALLWSLTAGCRGPSDKDKLPEFTLQRGKVERMFTCHIALDDDFEKSPHVATVRFACRSPSAALNQERWWGEQPKPNPVALDVGDCILLETDFFCVEEIDPGRSVLFRSRYFTATDAGNVLRHHGRPH